MFKVILNLKANGTIFVFYIFLLSLIHQTSVSKLNISEESNVVQCRKICNTHPGVHYPIRDLTPIQKSVSPSMIITYFLVSKILVLNSPKFSQIFQRIFVLRCSVLKDYFFNSNTTKILQISRQIAPLQCKRTVRDFHHFNNHHILA